MEVVQRAEDTLPALSEHVRVNHRGGHVGMAQQFLDGADVVPRCRRCVAKLCRKLCALITLVNPALCTATSMALLTTAGSTWWRRTTPLRGSVDTSRAGNKHCQLQSLATPGYLRSNA